MFMMLWSYIQVVRLDPGKPPLTLPIENTNDWQLLRKQFCQICQASKPERCHHCQACSRCVMQMDHHCPWVNNCIGYENRKHFILLLFYSGITSIICGLQLTVKFRNVILTLPQLDFQFLSLMISTIYNDSLAVAIILFFKFHLTLLSENLTTIENLMQKQLGTTDNSYDIGAMGNIKQIFGEKHILWFIPIKSNTNNQINGIKWPQNAQAIQQTKQIIIPPLLSMIPPLQIPQNHETNKTQQIIKPLEINKLINNPNKILHNKPQSMILKNIQSDQIPLTPSEINSDKRKNLFSQSMDQQMFHKELKVIGVS